MSLMSLMSRGNNAPSAPLSWWIRALLLLLLVLVLLYVHSAHRRPDNTQGIIGQTVVIVFSLLIIAEKIKS